MLTRADILMGRDKEYPLNLILSTSLDVLLNRINALEALCPFKFKLSSGYRPGKYNKAAGGAARSAHLTCEAVDIVDVRGVIKTWCIKNIDKLSELGLYMEDPAKTKTWVHLQTRKTKANPFKI